MDNQEYKDKIQLYLKILKEERENFQGFNLNREKKSQEYLKQTETERQKILSEFQKLWQFLEEKERLLLAELEKQDKEIVKIQNENVTKLSEEISHLSELISEMEGKYLKPVSKFLQDVRSTLSRFVIRGGGDCAYLNDLSAVSSLRCTSERHWICTKPDAFTQAQEAAVAGGS
ncbi:unnamed protein product [Eretmochelys imbricata]